MAPWGPAPAGLCLSCAEARAPRPPPTPDPSAAQTRGTLSACPHPQAPVQPAGERPEDRRASAPAWGRRALCRSRGANQACGRLDAAHPRCPAADRSGACQRPGRHTPGCPPLSRLPTVPGSGTRLSLVWLSAMHHMHRCPRGQAVVSDGRLGQWAPDSAGTRCGPSGNTIGHASLTWACAEAAVVCLRTHPAGPPPRARLAHPPCQGNALPSLAHRLPRAVSDRLKRPTALETETFLPGAGSSAGAPDASLAPPGSSLHQAGSMSCMTASVHAKVRIGL